MTMIGNNGQRTNFLRNKYRTYGRNRSQRLKEFDYSLSGYPSYITVSTKDNLRSLNNQKIAQFIVKAVDEAIQRFSLKAYILCVMPTHYHFLFELTEASKVSMMDVMKSINGRSGSFGLKILGQKLWQKGYYDHVVRKDEDLAKIAWYIAANPQRWRETGKFQLSDCFTVKWYVEL